MKNIQIQIFENKNYTISLFFIYNFLLLINNFLPILFTNILKPLPPIIDTNFYEKIEYN